MFNFNSVSDPISEEILSLCRTQKSRAESEELFKGRLTIAYVMEKYVKKQLASTIPEKPKSKNQRYYSI